MGKDLKGKNLGVGISQRSDGYYCARFRSKQTGKDVSKYFKKLQEARQWYADAKYDDEHGSLYAGSDMTVDTWFNIWLEQSSPTLADNTINIYKKRYEYNTPYEFKNMLLCDVKRVHCQQVINDQSEKYARNTVKKMHSLLLTVFGYAVENDLIKKNPMKNVKIPGETKKQRAMTKEEQIKFLNKIETHQYYTLYGLILQTGLRVSELVGLQWNDIDFDTKELHVRRQLQYFKDKGWVYSKPKTKTSIRTIPLTQEAIRLLLLEKERRSNIVNIEFSNLIFRSKHGNPLSRSALDNTLSRLCNEAGIEHYSLHSLRRTFCTRCIENGAIPRVVQEIMGHANLNITMQVYTDIQKDITHNEIERIEEQLNLRCV